MAKGLETGQPVPDFTLPGVRLTGDSAVRGEYTLSAERGRPVVLAFYPGDDTTVCTKQLCSYSSDLDRFTGLDAAVWGINTSGLDSHEAFARKHRLAMPLLADTDRAVAKVFGVSAPGIGVRRSVFVIGPDGVLHWKHVAVLGVTFQTVDAITAQLAALRPSS